MFIILSSQDSKETFGLLRRVEKDRRLTPGPQKRPMKKKRKDRHHGHRPSPTLQCQK